MKKYSLILLSAFYLAGCNETNLDTSYTLTPKDHSAYEGYGVKIASLEELQVRNQFSITSEFAHAQNMPFTTDPHIFNATTLNSREVASK